LVLISSIAILRKNDLLSSIGNVQYVVQVKGEHKMDAVNYTNFRKKLKEYMIQVNDDSEPLIVTNKDSDNDIVVLSKG
jgi:prevent-host-death family protein